jgi:alkylhydroperoxidase family enzyme
MARLVRPPKHNKARDKSIAAAARERVDQGRLITKGKAVTVTLALVSGWPSSAEARKNASPSPSPAPITPGTRPELAELEAKIVAKRGKVTALYQHLLNSPDMAQGWEEFTRAVRQRNSLPGDLRERVILRVAVLNRAPYEFDAHVPFALKEGMAAHKVEAVKETPISAEFTELEQLVLELTDTMTRDIEVPDALFSRIHAHFQGQALLDLCITIGAYNMVSRVLVALHIGH